jgi:hypothetical protein
MVRLILGVGQTKMKNTIKNLIESIPNVDRPLDYINKDHCDECLEHYEELFEVTVDKISFDIVANPGWDPTCFLTSSGFRYYLSGLIRICDDHPEWIETLIGRLNGFQGVELSKSDKDVILNVMNVWFNDDRIPIDIKEAIFEYINAAQQSDTSETMT